MLCETGPARPSAFRNIAWLAASILPLCAWFYYHWRRTGYVFGNPEYLRYNAEATLSPLRIALALFHRIAAPHRAHESLRAGVVRLRALLSGPARTCRTAARALLCRAVRHTTRLGLRREHPALLRARRSAAHALSSAALSAGAAGLRCGFLAARSRMGRLVALAAFAFCLGLFINPPYRFAPDDNLSYTDSIWLQQQAIHQAVTRYRDETILTAWPVSDELTKPELGYMRRPVSVVTINNFSLPQIQRAATLSGYTVGIIFSTKYDPPHLPFSLGPRNERLDRRYFDFHRDLPPEAIASMLGGKVVWHAERKGQWAAVLHFDRPQEARLR